MDDRKHLLLTAAGALMVILATLAAAPGDTATPAAQAVSTESASQPPDNAGTRDSRNAGRER